METPAAGAASPGGTTAPPPPPPPQGAPATNNTPTANNAAAAATNNNVTANNNNNNNDNDNVVNAGAPAPPQPQQQQHQQPASRFAPQIALGDQIAPTRGGRGGAATGGRGFGDRGGRGSARGGRGRGGTDTAVYAAQAAMEASPPLPPVANPAIVTTHASSSAAPIVPVGNGFSPQPTIAAPSAQQGARTFTAVVGGELTPLTPFNVKEIPEEHLLLVGFDHSSTLPLLPKKDAHRYELGKDAGGRPIPFVCYGTKNFDDIHGIKTEEHGFKRKAIESAARTVVVRTTVATSLPIYFIFDVQPTIPAGMWESRIQLVTMKDVDLNIDGLAAPTPVADDTSAEHVQHLLQGTVAQLQAHAHHVVIRNVIAGQNDTNRIVEAVGYPHGDWQKHLCGAPLHLVQEWRHAPRRATVKLAYDATSSLLKRFNECGEFTACFREHILACYLSGFTFRIILKRGFTMDYKRFFCSSPAVTDVYTDLRVAMTPARVGEEPTSHELDIAAQTVTPDEEPLFAGLVSTVRPPPDIWATIAAKLGLRLIHHNIFGCVFGCARANVGGLVGKTLSGWARLSRTRLG